MDELRICRTCKKEKPLSAFNVDKRHSSGYATQCKECKHAYDKARYDKIKNNPEYHARKLEHGAKYRDTHKEQIQEYSSLYNMRPEVVDRKASWYQEKMAKMKMVRKQTTTLADIRVKIAFKSPTFAAPDFVKDRRIKCVGKIDMKKVNVSPVSSPLSPRSNLLKLVCNILINK